MNNKSQVRIDDVTGVVEYYNPIDRTWNVEIPIFVVESQDFSNINNATPDLYSWNPGGTLDYPMISKLVIDKTTGVWYNFYRLTYQHSSTGNTNSNAAYSKSLDGGETWTSEGTTITTGLRVVNVSAFVTKTGRIGCVYEVYDDTGALSLDCIVSDDEGATWSAPTYIWKRVDTPAYSYYRNFENDVQYQKDGTLIMSGATWDGGTVYELITLISSDNGATWTEHSKVYSGSEKLAEPQLRILEDGRGLITSRMTDLNTAGYNVPQLFYTDDWGTTWDSGTGSAVTEADLDAGNHHSSWAYLLGPTVGLGIDTDLKNAMPFIEFYERDNEMYVLMMVYSRNNYNSGGTDLEAIANLFVFKLNDYLNHGVDAFVPGTMTLVRQNALTYDGLNGGNCSMKLVGNELLVCVPEHFGGTQTMHYIRVKEDVLTSIVNTYNNVSAPGGATISDIAYDAISWDNNLDGASKNTLRDKFESLAIPDDILFINGANAENVPAANVNRMKMNGTTAAAFEASCTDAAGNSFMKMTASDGSYVLFNKYGSAIGGTLFGLSRNLMASMVATSGVLAFGTTSDADFVLGRNGVAEIIIKDGYVDFSNAIKLSPQAAHPLIPVDGMVYPNSTVNHIYGRINGAWVQLDNDAASGATNLCDLGTTDFAADLILANASTDEETILISTPITVNTNLTVDENVTLKFTCDGVLNIDVANTITLEGKIDADPYTQIISTTGTNTILGTPVTDTWYPEWFGATRDGATDDLVQFRQVAKVLENRGGGTFQLHNGHYQVWGYVDIRSNTKVLGKGWGTIVESATIVANQEYIRIESWGTVWFERGVLWSLGVSSDGARHYTVDVENVEIRDMKILYHDTTMGLPQYGASKTTTAPIYIGTKRNNAGHIHSTSIVKDVIVDNIYMDDVMIGILCGDSNSGVYPPDHVSFNWNEDITISNCWINGTSNRAIELQNTKNSKIVSNRTYNADAGIQVHQYSENIEIYGNIVEYGEIGISVNNYAKNVIITDNTVTRTGTGDVQGMSFAIGVGAQWSAGYENDWTYGQVVSSLVISNNILDSGGTAHGFGTVPSHALAYAHYVQDVIFSNNKVIGNIYTNPKGAYASTQHVSNILCNGNAIFGTIINDANLDVVDYIIKDCAIEGVINITVGEDIKFQNCDFKDNVTIGSSVTNSSVVGCTYRQAKSITVSGATNTEIYNTQLGAEASIPTPLTTKGDLYTFSTIGARLGVGADDEILIADSAEATGMKWGPNVASGGGLTWNEVPGTSQAMAVNNGYISNNAALVTNTLPDTAAVGDVVRVGGKGAGGWAIAQNASEIIHFIDTDTTTGVGGSLASSSQYDSIELVCIVANTEWLVVSSMGNITIV